MRDIFPVPWSDLHFDEKDEDGQIRILGAGSFGMVLAATFSHMRVAVKQLPPGRRLPPAAVAELEREAALQARLSHDHVVRVFGFAVSTADPARPKYGLVMARLHEQLQAVLERAAAGDGPPPPLAWRLSAVHQVALGLAYLHARRVVHADVKPANVMLTAPETGSLLQLTDFGLAKEVGTGGSVLGTMGGGGAHGTVAWMAPELLAPPAPGQPPARPSFRTDVYAWGVLAWQLLTLAPAPFSGLNEEQVRGAVARGDRPDFAALPAGVPDALRALIARCWDAAPGSRPRSGGDLLEALREACPDAARVVPLHAPPRAAGGAAAPPAAVAWRAALVLPECPICQEEQQPGVALGCGNAEHKLCLGCTLRRTRGELGEPGNTMVRCPLPHAPPDAPVAEAAVMEAHAWAAAVHGAGELRPLSLQDLGRFAGMQRAREEAEERARARREAEERLPEGLFKRCPGPGCGVPIQHARGHHCHHIKPGTGCPQCGTHFCYACLRIYLPGESRLRPCANGCPLFCSERCDCVDCVDCAPGRPCADCDNDGRCWTCQPERRPRAPPAPRPPAAAPAAAGGGGGGGGGAALAAGVAAMRVGGGGAAADRQRAEELARAEAEAAPDAAGALDSYIIVKGVPHRNAQVNIDGDFYLVYKTAKK